MSQDGQSERGDVDALEMDVEAGAMGGGVQGAQEGAMNANNVHGLPTGEQVEQDEAAFHVQMRFLRFLQEFSLRDIIANEDEADRDELDDSDDDSDDILPYGEQVKYMTECENTTLHVDFGHVLRADGVLAEAILGDYYRYMPYLNKSVQSFVRSQFPDYVQGEHGASDREFFVSFFELPHVEKIRELRTDKIGRLLAISGTVTRSSEVRPELLFGKFECLKCGRIIEDVEQQFKFTEPMCCTNTECKNVTMFLHLHQEGKFVDWQKLKVQENSNEVPAGSMPRTVDIVVRHEAVERAKPGDKCIFIGTLVAIPDVAKLKSPGDGPGMLAAPRGRRTKEENGHGVTGIKALGVREMSYKLAFLACSIQSASARFGGMQVVSRRNLSKRQHRLRMLQQQQRNNASESLEEETPESIREQYSPEDTEELRLMASQPNLLMKMRRSIAPSVHGHEDIKLGVLLMLFGGVHKRTPDGIKLRGDINVCIVGDPSTAKSQFLKYVCSFLPRAIYTSGKASSAAGLTASVVKDPETGEFCIEAGALMLADNGICCIDEFDKMDDVDQVAIHEAMEQQTISITKAGIQATLNARTSILAAANPVHGRYDRSKTLRHNVQLSPAIMSRFDMFFVVLDECEESQDKIIAEHIIRVHRNRIAMLVQNRDPEEFDEAEAVQVGGADLSEARQREQSATAGPGADSQAEQNAVHRFSRAQLQNYIRFARTIDPIIPPDVQPRLVDCYRKLRQGDSTGPNQTAYRITVRQLEALIRLAEALARLHLDDTVRPRYVDWAFHLLKTSIVHVESADVRFDEPGAEARPGCALDPNRRRRRGRRGGGLGDPQGREGGVVGGGVDMDDASSISSGGSLLSSSGSSDDGLSDNEDDARGGDASKGDAGHTGPEEDASAVAPKGNRRKRRRARTGVAPRAATTQLSFEEYSRITKLVCAYLRKREDEMRADGLSSVAVLQAEVVAHFLETRDLVTEEQIVEERLLINQIIDRLIHKDGTLMEAPTPDDHLASDAEGELDEEERAMRKLFPGERRWLIVHPNYDPAF